MFHSVHHLIIEPIQRF